MKRYFQNKTVLITGGASGIGRALCLSLAEAGSHVYVADINGTGARLVADQIRAKGGNALSISLDVSSRDDVSRAIKTVCEQSEKIDIIVNNAGISVGGEVRFMTSAHWNRIIDVNLRGVLNGTLEAYQVMIRQGFGQIVNVSSYLGLVGVPITTAYNTTKFAIVGLSTSLRQEAAALGVKVNTVCPGYVATDLIDAGTMVQGTASQMKNLIPVAFYPPDKAALKIMKGVADDKTIIVFPFHAKLFWWLNRVHINLLNPVFRRVLKDLGKINSERGQVIK